MSTMSVCTCETIILGFLFAYLSPRRPVLQMIADAASGEWRTLSPGESLSLVLKSTDHLKDFASRA